GPLEILRALGPERLEVRGRLLIDRGGVHVGVLRELLRRREAAILGEQDVDVGHARILPPGGTSGRCARAVDFHRTAFTRRAPCSIRGISSRPGGIPPKKSPRSWRSRAGAGTSTSSTRSRDSCASTACSSAPCTIPATTDSSRAR